MNETGTTRLEAFSDGVFAIAATLLILEVSVDSVRGVDLEHRLVHIWPSYLAYVTSFLIIGIIWMNHHHTVAMMARVDRTFLFVNMLLLLVVSFIPFPTRLVAQYLHKPGERAATVAYAATLLTMAVVFNIWWRYARGHRRLIADAVTDARLRAVDRAFNPGVPAYAVVFAIAFVSPLATIVITLGLAVFYLPSATLFER